MTEFISKPGIGVFDSGLGGLTVLKELRRVLPNERFVYLGDTARTPYGTRSVDTVKSYLFDSLEFLFKRNVKYVVLACHTATAIALESAQTKYEVPIVGTIAPTIEAVLGTTKNQNIAIIGTAATIKSGVYQNALSSKLDDAVIYDQVCPLFVTLVEQGLFSGEIVDLTIDYYLSSIKNTPIDTLILACTHYPFLVDSLNNYFDKHVRIIDCSLNLALAVKEKIAKELVVEMDVQECIGGTEYFVTNDVERFNKYASKFLGIENVKASHASFV